MSSSAVAATTTTTLIVKTGTEGERKEKKRKRDHSQDRAKPVDLCAVDGIWLEKIVLYEFDALLRQGEAVLFRPDFVFGHVKDRAPILQDKVKRRVEM